MPQEQQIFPQSSTVVPSAQETISRIQGPQTSSRELTALAKLYTSEDYKYSGISADFFDSLDYKFAIFGDFCRKSGIISEILPDAFSIMLR
ncbi:hypothetical protein GcM3_024050, partial [Golovinomyces cichoracearum]